MTAVLGLDLSLSSTGVAKPDATTEVITTGDDWPLEDREGELELRLIELLAGVDWVGCEEMIPNARYAGPKSGVAHGAFCSAYNQTGGRAHLVRFPPSCVKKLATGNGNASKDAVLVEAVKRLGYDGHSTDEADAIWCRAAVQVHLGELVRLDTGEPVELPQKHLDALKSIVWPDAEVEK